jgi:hypothetical protein
LDLAAGFGPGAPGCFGWHPPRLFWREAGLDLIALLSITGAMALGEYLTGALARCAASTSRTMSAKVLSPAVVAAIISNGVAAYTLYGLDAVLRRHFAQEDEIYHTLRDLAAEWT